MCHNFGGPEADREIPLRTDWMTQTTPHAFGAKFGQTGSAWKSVGNKLDQYRVFFRQLDPERIRRHTAYPMEMLLGVVELVASCATARFPHR